LKNSITKCSNTSTPEPDKLLWRYLKVIVNDSTSLNNFINIANVCINLEHWSFHFKISSSIIIPKPNKTSYNTPFFNVDIDVGQGSALSSVLSALYLSIILHIFEKRLKNLKILISIISFVDNRLFVS